MSQSIQLTLCRKVFEVHVTSILCSKNSDQDTPRIHATTLPYSTWKRQNSSQVSSNKTLQKRTGKDQWNAHKVKIYLMTNALRLPGIFSEIFLNFST